MSDDAVPYLRELDDEECIALLRSHNLGRIAFCRLNLPVVLPINFRLVELTNHRWIVIRTRPGNIIDRTPMPVAFEIDGADPHRRVGWSVLVRGHLAPLDPDIAIELGQSMDPDPWIAIDRDRWLVIDIALVTGRELCEPALEWALPSGYR